MVGVTSTPAEPPGRAPGTGRGALLGRRRLVVGVAAALALLLVAVLAALAVLAVQVEHPRYDAIRPADAVVVLGEPDRPALELAERLLDDGVSDRLVLLAPWGDPPECGDPPAGVTVTCLVPDPRTTQGDARAIRDIAAENGWTSLVVVTWATHVSRSRVLIEACFPGTVMMTGYPLGPDGAGVGELVHQVGGYAKALLTPGC